VTVPYLDHPPPLAFAHRGGAEEFPENSLAAFTAAAAMGFRYLETDVHLSADGVVVAFHDDVLDRVTDGSGEVAALTWDEIRDARIGGTEPIPTMGQLLEAFPDARFNIDAKSEAVVEPLLDLIRQRGATQRVCIGAFDDERLARVRASLPGVCTTTGPNAIARLKAGSLRVPAGRVAGDCAQVPIQHGRWTVVTRRFVQAAHRRGVQVHVWTIDDPDEMDDLLDLGVDGIMTDRPSVLREVCRSRGAWPAD
jgi:glycerophosphoryl diester phosphodiesterase